MFDNLKYFFLYIVNPKSLKACLTSWKILSIKAEFHSLVIYCCYILWYDSAISEQKKV